MVGDGGGQLAKALKPEGRKFQARWVSSWDVIYSTVMLGNNTKLYAWNFLSVLNTHTHTHTVTCEVTEMWISLIMVIIYRYVCMSHHQTVHFKYKQLEKEGLTCPETGALLYIQGDPGSERGEHARRWGQRGGVEVRGRWGQQSAHWPVEDQGQSESFVMGLEAR